MKKHSVLLWFIVFSFFPFAWALYQTVVVALDNPVVMDSSYNSYYQKVNKDINALIESQHRFDSRYNVEILLDGTLLPQRKQSFVHSRQPLTHINSSFPKKFTITLLSRENNSTAEGNISIKLTRPETDQFDQMLEVAREAEGNYTALLNKLPKAGRWIVRVEINASGERGFFEREFFLQ
ncbi:MAG: FixH family protein [Campylobacterales bacterium]